MSQYRKKALVIDAIPWVPDAKPECYPEWFWKEFGLHPELLDTATGNLSIKTLEGTMIAKPGDWIIRGVKGELYPCKSDVFNATYEPATPTDQLTTRAPDALREAAEKAVDWLRRTGAVTTSPDMKEQIEAVCKPLAAALAAS